MKNKGKIIITERNITKGIVAVFSLLFLSCLIAAFWNPFQLVFAAMCGAVINMGLRELDNG